MSKFKFYTDIARSSVVAGIMIGIGCIANLSVGGGLLGAILFSIGLIAVVTQSRWLYTGRIGYINYKDKDDCICTLVSLIFNLVGIGVTTYLFSHFAELQPNTLVLAQNKVNMLLAEDWTVALARSIGCGALMYIAVEGYRESRNVLTIILPVVVFILCGFDHCIANYGYLTFCNLNFCTMFPIWIVGNTIGALAISKL